jgi:hypothetical protein
MSTPSRLKDTARHEAGALDERFGIVTGRLVQYADALDIDPQQVPAAIEAAGIEPIVDTAERKPRETHNRPTDPRLRSLAVTRSDFARLLANGFACGTSDHDPRGQVRPSDAAKPPPNETEPMPKAEPRDKTENLKVRLSPGLMKHLEAAAKREGRTVSGYVRQTLRRQLDIERRVFGPKKEAA